ncbi:hypothetical protein, partial [Rhizobium leguminosarum]|uniref:hypothetical protein n=1 Tax=Rhizobium leguminosarum TaxID=384 RepID=UPI003F9B3F04
GTFPVTTVSSIIIIIDDGSISHDDLVFVKGSAMIAKDTTIHIRAGAKYPAIMRNGSDFDINP